MLLISYTPVAVIGFNQSTYSVHEQSGQDSSVDVCVQLISGTIAPGVSIDYTLEYDATGTTQGDMYIIGFTGDAKSVTIISVIACTYIMHR